jgi:hypothetical protein
LFLVVGFIALLLGVLVLIVVAFFRGGTEAADLHKLLVDVFKSGLVGLLAIITSIIGYYYGSQPNEALRSSLLNAEDSVAKANQQMQVLEEKLQKTQSEYQDWLNVAHNYRARLNEISATATASTHTAPPILMPVGFPDAPASGPAASAPPPGA